MSTFIPITNTATADLLSRRLFELSRPSGVPCEGCVTTHLLRWVIHPVSLAVSMEIPDGFDFPVHQVADGETVRPIIQPFITAGKVTVAEVDSLVALVQAKIGDRLQVWQIIPEFWKGMSLNREQMKAAGWFPDPVTLKSVAAESKLSSGIEKR